MYNKAVQTQIIWAFAYEVPMGGYALSLSYIGSKPILDDEPQFERIQSLEVEMQEIAPLTQWSKQLFQSLVS